MSRKIVAAAVFAALVVTASAFATTLSNLQLAYTSETRAHANDVAYAEKADLDGYPSVASLFRALALAEEVHANALAPMITERGGTPAAAAGISVVKSTAENLQAAMEAETYDRQVMYPGFLRIARQENADSDVLRILNYAEFTEGQHAKVIAAALQELPKLRGLLETYYVCTVCGNVTTSLDFETCPECRDPSHHYVVVH